MFFYSDKINVTMLKVNHFDLQMSIMIIYVQLKIEGRVILYSVSYLAFNNIYN